MKLKVICLNMWNGGKLFDNIKDFIAQEQPDMLALQEVYNDETYPPEKEWHAAANLASILGYPYYAFNPAFSRTEPSGHRVQNGNAILSKFPIKESTSTFYDIPFNSTYTQPSGDASFSPRNLQQADIEVDNKILYFFNTQGIWGFDGHDHERRLAMGATIAQQVAGKAPALLMGDFNVQEGTQTIAHIEKHMRSIFKGEMKTSFNLRHKQNGGFATAIVDMMFVSPDIHVLSHRVSDADVSDHLALIAEVEV